MKTNPNDICHQNISQDMAGNLHHGLTKREYFAALAMQGILACPTGHGSTSEKAVRLADKLIEELNKEVK